jgi:hypothetical protein
MTVAVDGTPAHISGAGGTQSVTLTTPTAGDLIVVVVGIASGNSGSYPANPGTVTSVTASGLTFTKRGSGSGAKQMGPTGGGIDLLGSITVFTATAASALTALSITANITAGPGTTNETAVIAFGLSGVSATAFDANASLPTVASSTTAADLPSVAGVSTTTANDFLFGVALMQHPNTGLNLPGIGYTELSNVGTTSLALDIQYKNVTATQSGVTVAFGTGENTGTGVVGYIMYADALQASGASSYNQTVTATCTTTATFSKLATANRTLPATCTSTSTLSRVVSFKRTLSAVCTSTSVLLRSIAKTLAATCTSTSTLIRKVAKSFAATCTSTSVLTSTATTRLRSLAATCTSTATIAVGRAYLRVLVTTCTSTAVMTKLASYKRALSATCTSTLTTLRKISKTLAAACTSTLTGLATRVKLVFLTATCTSTAAMSKIAHYPRALLATCTSTLTGAKGLVLHRTLVATCTSTANVAHLFYAHVVALATNGLATYILRAAPSLGPDNTKYMMKELQTISKLFNAHVQATKALDARLTKGGL